MKVKVFLLLMLFAMEGFAQGKLKVGDQAPDFTANDQDGKKVSLRNYRGSKVVLYFYPKDDTPGCTAQACNLRDNISTLTSEGYVVLGVSGDDEESHKAFREKYNLPFTLVADTDKSINKAYGVWVEKERNGNKYWGTARTTFILDENGIITEIIDNVDTKQHAGQILKL